MQPALNKYNDSLGILGNQSAAPIPAPAKRESLNLQPVKGFNDSLGILSREKPIATVDTGTLKQMAAMASASDYISAMKAAGMPEDEIKAELGGIEETWLQPVDAFSGGFGAGAKFAISAGRKIPAIIGRGLAAGIPGAVMEYPIGQAAGLVADDLKHPELAFLLAVGTGLVSGITIENLAEKGLLKLSRRLAQKWAAKPKIQPIAEALGVDVGAIKTMQAKESAGAVMEKFKTEPKPEPVSPIPGKIDIETATPKAPEAVTDFEPVRVEPNIISPARPLSEIEEVTAKAMPEPVFTREAPEALKTALPEAAGATISKQATPAPMRIRKPRGGQVRTLRGAIKNLGGINFLNFKGELREMPTAVKFLSKKNGMPVDLAEESLRADGWLNEGESLLELFRNKEVLRRGKVTEADTWGLKDLPEGLTESQQRFKDEMSWEPEAPPDGNYTMLKADELPEGKTLTIVDGHGSTGWDVYKINRKGEKIVLEDGTDIELNPSDRVEVLTSDLSGDTRPQHVSRYDTEGILKLHPSTITGPVGGLAAGVDWDEYEKSGNIKIDPKRALLGFVAGAAGPVALKKGAESYKTLASWWDDAAGKHIIDPLKNTLNGLIVNEELRHLFGMNRSAKFKDLLRDHYRDIERIWNRAAEVGQELKKLAPTPLEQKRLMQVVRGGVTASKEMAAKARQVNEMFADLRDQLKEYSLLEYSRFDRLTRRERADLRNIIQKDKSTRKIHEDEFYKRYPDIKPPDEQPFRDIRQGQRPPEWATEEIPISQYDKTPKTSAEWARQKLHDHYHFGSAEEYAPVYYDVKEGLSPRQKELLLDEINRLKVKSRRGNPEGVPELEDMISKMEMMLGKGKQARAELRKTRAALNKQYSHRRLEIPYEVQKMMGLIDEAAYPVAKMLGVQGSDVAKAKLFKHISEISAWALPGKKQGAFIAEYPANFVEVRGEAFGTLDGMYVRRDIWDSLSEIEDMRSQIGRNYDKLLGYWKAGKVIWNPATHMRNAMSNVILAYLGDVHPGDVKTYGKAFKAVRGKAADKFYKEAEDWGLFNNTFVSAEITKLRDELDSLRDVGTLKTWIRKATSMPGTLYEENEKLFKMAVFIKARESGASIDQAARKAEKFLFNYGDIPPWVKHSKRWVSPFMTFTFKALPLAAEMMIRKPVKMASIAAAMYGVQKFSQSMLGYTDEQAEKQRQRLPDWQKSKAPPGVGPYTHILMPWRDAWGNDLYFDTSYILPWGNVGEKWGQSGMPLSDILGPSPLLGITAGLFANRDTFSGRDIYNKVLDSAAVRLQKQLEYAWKELSPPMAPGGSNFNKILTGFKNTVMGKDVRDWADRPVELHTALLSTMLGIKLSPANDAKLKLFELREMNKIVQSVRTERGRLSGKLRSHKIDKKEYNKELRDLVELEKRLLKEMRK